MMSITLDASLQSQVIPQLLEPKQSDDTMRDHEGDSYLNGNWGNDTIYGNDSNDILCGR